MARDIDGELKTFNDIYGRDAAVLASFDAARVGNRARVTDEEVIEIQDDLQASWASPFRGRGGAKRGLSQ